MAKVAEDYSDIVFLTSDNPRNEDPIAILKDMEAGMTSEGYEVIVNRSEAIQKAIEIAEPNDIILIAGKGHEDYQIIGDIKTHFSDTEEALKAIQNKVCI